MATAAGVDPRPFTLGDLSKMAGYKWDATIAVVSAIVEGGKNPYRPGANLHPPGPSADEFRAKTKALGLPKWQPPG